jgi:hypothetical protein
MSLMPGFGAIAASGAEPPPVGANSIQFAVFSSRTTVGNQDVTVNLGGQLPKAVLFIPTNATVDKTVVAGGTNAMGAADGTLQFCAAATDYDTDTHSNISEPKAINYQRAASAGALRTAEFVSFIADGVRINWTAVPAVAEKFIAVFFAGVDCQAQLVKISSPATSPGTAVPTSFEPELMFVFSANQPESSDGGFGRVSLGFVHNNKDGCVFQRCGATYTDTATWRSIVYRRRAGAQSFRVTVDYELDFSAFGPTGFTATASASAGTDVFYALCISWGGNVAIRVGTQVIGPAAASQPFNGLGFQPETLLWLTPNAVNNGDPIGASMQLGFAIADALGQMSSQRAYDEQQIISQSTIHGLLTGSAGAADYEATLASLDADGATLSFSDGPALSQLWPYCAISTVAAPPVIPKDTLWTSVKLLLAAKGTAATAEDESNERSVPTFVGNAQAISNEFVLDGVGDWITLPDSPNWQLTGDFCWEFFNWKFDDVGVIQLIASHYDAISPQTNKRGWILIFRGNNTPKTLDIAISTAGTSATLTTPIAAEWPALVSTPYHIALRRSGTTLRLHADGVLLGSATYSSTSFNTDSPLAIGQQSTRASSPPTPSFKGKGAVVRATLGSDRYGDVDTFTPDSLPLPVC